MTRMINKRYQLEFEYPKWNNFEIHVATDKRSPEEDNVLIYLLRRSRASQLVESVVSHRGSELMHYSNRFMAPFLDFGYDSSIGAYFFTYAMTGGDRLDREIKQKPKSFEWKLQFAQLIAGFLSELHNQGIVHGALEPNNIFIPQSTGTDIPIVCNSVGLLGITFLLTNTNYQEEESSFEKLVIEDINCFSSLLSFLICEKPEPLPAEVRDALEKVSPRLFSVLSPLLGTKNSHNYLRSFPEIRMVIEQAQQALSEEETYFVSMTRTAITRLVEDSYIPEDRDYLANEFFNQQTETGVSAWATTSTETTYRLTTSRFRFYCVPDSRTTPSTHLVVKSISFVDSVEANTDHENSLAINARLIAKPLSKIPTGANVTPLVEKIDRFVQSAKQSREIQIERKDNLSNWERVLEEQRRQLRAFQLIYVDLVHKPSESILELKVSNPPDDLNLRAENLVRLTNEDGNQQRAGYFDGLQDDKLIIAIASGVDVDQFKKSGVVTMDNEQIESILRRQNKAIKRLRYGETVNPRLPFILTQASTADLRVDYPLTFDFWYQPNLDDSQKKAVSNAASARDLFLVHGPPGTGKTSMIAELVLQIIQLDPKSKILITSQSNVAVNNALEHIGRLRPDIASKTVRVGREEKANTTRELLIDRQLGHWAEEVVKRSDEYLTEWRGKISGDTELTKTLNLLEEGIKADSQISLHKATLEDTRQQLQRIETEYEKLIKDLELSRNLRQKAEGLLARIPAGDERLHQIVEDFDRNFLQWAESYIENLDEKIGISENWVTKSQEIERLEAQILDIAKQIDQNIALVNGYLLNKYNCSFTTLAEQHNFLDDKLSIHREEISRLARIEAICADWWHRVGKDRAGFESAYLSQCNVIGATCIGVAARGEVSEMDFDWVIIDEAGRATHLELLVPMVRGRKIVLVGDHLQLPPTLDQLTAEAIDQLEDVSRKDFETSFFQELMNTVPKTVVTPLDIQYRMHSAIGDMIGECFYDGKKNLRSGAKNKDKQHGLEWCPAPIVWYSTTQLPNYREVKVGTSYRNESEIKVILGILDKIEASYAATGETNKTIGIISGYLAQKSELRKRIKGRQDRWPHLSQIEVDTVDAFQGRECSLIIYSVVRSNPEKIIGFLRDERRLNVALSRAKDLVLIVGTEEVEFARASGTNPFRTIIQYMRKNPAECRFEVWKR